MSGRWPSAASTRWPVSTRPGAVPAPDPWWPPPSCSTGPFPAWPTPSCSPEKKREACYDLICERAVDLAVVVIEAPDCDRIGLHRANIAALRRALARLEVRPGYVLTDGFPVDGLGVPGPGGLEGRPGGRFDRRGLGDRQGDPRPADGAAARPASRPTTSPRTRVTSPTCTTPGSVSTDPCAEHRLSFINVRAAMEGRTDEL